MQSLALASVRQAITSTRVGIAWEPLPRTEYVHGNCGVFMNYKFKTKPYAHQLTALEKSWNRETYAYFMEIGTGKTKVLIDKAAMLYDKGK